MVPGGGFDQIFSLIRVKEGTKYSTVIRRRSLANLDHYYHIVVRAWMCALIDHEVDNY